MLKPYWKRVSILLLLVILTIALLTAATRPKDDPFLGAAIIDKPFPSLTYGIQAFLWWDSGHVGLHLDWVNLMSFTHVKQVFAWRDLEPRPDEWHFEQSDRIIGEVERRNLKLIARLGKTPEWAASAWQDHADSKMTDAPADNRDDWHNYCHTIAERYQGRIAAYQIWNEPNLSREWGNKSPDAEDYVDLLRVCSEAIRNADPDAIIISAGLAPTGTNSVDVLPDDVYLDHMYRNEFQQYVDAVGVHAPGFSPPAYGPDDAERDRGGRWFTFRRVEDLRKIMILYDDAARQMAILEFGWTTDTQNGEYSWYAVDEETQAKHLLEAYQYAIDHWRPWVGLMTVIYLPDPSWTEADEEYWWAISTPSLQQRQAFYDLANMQKICDDYVIPERDPNSPEAQGIVPADACP